MQPAPLPENVEQRPVRCRLAIRLTMPGQVRQRSGVDAPLEFVQQTRFADSRFTRDPDDLTIALLHLRQ
jgi:hypothetical protein